MNLRAILSKSANTDNLIAEIKKHMPDYKDVGNVYYVGNAILFKNLSERGRSSLSLEPFGDIYKANISFINDTDDKQFSLSFKGTDVNKLINNAIKDYKVLYTHMIK